MCDDQHLCHYGKLEGLFFKSAHCTTNKLNLRLVRVLQYLLYLYLYHLAPIASSMLCSILHSPPSPTIVQISFDGHWIVGTQLSSPAMHFSSPHATASEIPIASRQPLCWSMHFLLNMFWVRTSTDIVPQLGEPAESHSLPYSGGMLNFEARILGKEYCVLLLSVKMLTCTEPPAWAVSNVLRLDCLVLTIAYGIVSDYLVPILYHISSLFHSPPPYLIWFNHEWKWEDDLLS